MEAGGLLSSFRKRYDAALKPWVGSAVLLPLCAYFALTRGVYTFLDAADLVIHEAGHVFFAPFGPFLRMAGGTLMQILLPLALVWHFLRNEYRFGAQVMLFWLGHNLINVSVYAADARVRRLPLLGGDRAVHDWGYMLGRLGALEHDALVGGVFFALALAAFAFALVLPRFTVD
ncbi:hypothetical protein [Rhodocaloribacter sp.]